VCTSGYNNNNNNNIAVIVLTYSWLRFPDKPLFTTCVFVCMYIQTRNIYVFDSEGSTACNVVSTKHQLAVTQIQQYDQYAHSIDVSCAVSVADWTSVVQRMMICYEHAYFDRWSTSYGRVEGGFILQVFCSFNNTSWWWQNWVQKISQKLMRQPW
jgi:hypothetical protein